MPLTVSTGISKKNYDTCYTILPEHIISIIFTIAKSICKKKTQQYCMLYSCMTVVAQC